MLVLNQKKKAVPHCIIHQSGIHENRVDLELETTL